MDSLGLRKWLALAAVLIGSTSWGQQQIPAHTVPANMTNGNAAPKPNPTTGTGNFVLSTSPTLVTPNLGQPSYIDLSNAINTPPNALAPCDPFSLLANMTAAPAPPTCVTSFTVQSITTGAPSNININSGGAILPTNLEFPVQSYGSCTNSAYLPGGGDIGPCANLAYAACQAAGGGVVIYPPTVTGQTWSTPISNLNGSYCRTQGAGYNERLATGGVTNYQGGTLLKWTGSAPTAAFTGTLSGTTLTVSGVSGTIAVGMIIRTGTGVPTYTQIISGSGTTWTVTGPGASVGPESMTATSPAFFVGTWGTADPYYNVSGAGVSGMDFDCADTVQFCVVIEQVLESTFDFAASRAAANGTVVTLLADNAVGNGIEYDEFKNIFCATDTNAVCIQIDQQSGGLSDESLNRFDNVYIWITPNNGQTGTGDGLVECAGDNDDFAQINVFPFIVSAGKQPPQGHEVVMANTAYVASNGIGCNSINGDNVHSGEHRFWHTGAQVFVLGSITGSVLTQTVGTSAAIGPLPALTSTAAANKSTSVITFTSSAANAGWVAGETVTCAGNGASAGPASGVMPNNPILAVSTNTITLQNQLIWPFNNYPGSPSTSCVASYSINPSAITGKNSGPATYYIGYFTGSNNVLNGYTCTASGWCLAGPAGSFKQNGVAAVVASGSVSYIPFNDMLLPLPDTAGHAPANGDTWTMTIPGPAGSTVVDGVVQGNGFPLGLYENGATGYTREVAQAIPTGAPGFGLPVVGNVTAGNVGFGFNFSGVVNDPVFVDGVFEFANITCTFCKPGTLLVDWQVGGNSMFKLSPVGNLTIGNQLTSVSAQTGTLQLNQGVKFTVATSTGCSTANGTPTGPAGGPQSGHFTAASRGTGCTYVVTINGASGKTTDTGWECWATDVTTASPLYQSGESTTQVTFIGTVNANADVISFGCLGN